MVISDHGFTELIDTHGISAVPLNDKLTGIKGERVLRRYAHFGVEHLRSAVVDLDEMRAEKDAERFSAVGE